MVVLKFINKIWRREEQKKTNESKDEKVRKITKHAIKKYEKVLRRLAYE